MVKLSKFDVIIAGAGAAGLYCALLLDPGLKTLLLSKTRLKECNSYLAQGGITTVSREDKLSFMRDTLLAGQEENDPAAVELLAEKAPETIARLIEFGMPFSGENGRIAYTKEGAHSKRRIAYAKDETGKHLVETLLAQLAEHRNVTVWEQSALLDILREPEGQNPACLGALVQKEGRLLRVAAAKTVLACGGIGGLFRETTNAAGLTGDAIAIAFKHGIALKDLDHIQFHPTSLYAPEAGRRFLLSESLRGEGARLLNAQKKRFVDELQPRDAVCAAIKEELKKFPRLPYVYLDISHLEANWLRERFPMIHRRCLDEGYDMTKDPIPVIPSQHYHMGGLQIDLAGRTSLANLYAIGEAACSGAHGANRLASNSLLEALVFAAQAAQDINGGMAPAPPPPPRQSAPDKELTDASLRARLVQSLLSGGNGGIADELCDY
ncbi:MAG: L-aspartate oxidase [Clostridiales bacterium]|nr:L-aspartate oxidase [Clostridiales bacterium]